MSFLIADVIFWIAVACCSVAQLAIIHSVIVSPARAAGSPPTSGVRRAGEIAWAVIPGIALAIVLLFTWRAMQSPLPHLLPSTGFGA
jgi:heme/copper-type cytochrome/quinol oxidase subunit 2